MKKLFLFLLILTISISTIAFADLPPLQNVTLEDGVLSWDELEGASYYYIVLLDFTTESGTYNFDSGSYIGLGNNEYDLKQLFDNNSFKTAEYHLKLLASNTEDADNHEAIIASAISQIESITYNYTSSKTELPAPTNLVWDGYIAKWDAVENASSYDIVLYCSDTDQYDDSFTGKTENQYDFSAFCTPNYLYSFSVKANAGSNSTEFLDGNYSDFSDFMINGLDYLTLPEISGFTINSNNILTWNAVADAKGYYIIVSDKNQAGVSPFDVPVYVESSTELDLTPYYNATTNTELQIEMYAYKQKSGNKLKISHEALLNIEVPEKIINGDIDNDKSITITDVRLLLQLYLNPSPYDPRRCDIDNNGKIDITDVRLLLQKFIELGAANNK